MRLPLPHFPLPSIRPFPHTTFTLLQRPRSRGWAPGCILRFSTRTRSWWRQKQHRIIHQPHHPPTRVQRSCIETSRATTWRLRRGSESSSSSVSAERASFGVTRDCARFGSVYLPRVVACSPHDSLDMSGLLSTSHAFQSPPSQASFSSL